MRGLAEHIVDTKLADFDPAHLEDRYRTKLVSMLREKHATIPPRAAPAVPSPKNVINLMDMLQRSLAAERSSSSKTVRSRPLRAAAASSKADAAKRSKVRARRSSR
jgi:non-homologous end joining protein Ku